jgi:hypothetical protein
LSSLAFEFDSQLTRIETKVFSWCGALKSICLPSSYAVPSDLKLIQIDDKVFFNGHALKSICIPAPVEVLCKEVFAAALPSRH